MNNLLRKLLEEYAETVTEVLNDSEEILIIAKKIRDDHDYKVTVSNFLITLTPTSSDEKPNKIKRPKKERIVFSKEFTAADEAISHGLGIKIEPKDIEKPIIGPPKKTTARLKPEEKAVQLLKEDFLKLALNLNIRKKNALVDIINSDLVLSENNIKFNKDKIDISDKSAFTKEMQRIIDLTAKNKDAFNSIQIIISVFLINFNIKG